MKSRRQKIEDIIVEEITKFYGFKLSTTDEKRALRTASKRILAAIKSDLPNTEITSREATPPKP